jgi:hypothetical protein
MATSDLWRDLAAEFRALPGGSALRGDWDYTSGRPCQWRFAGTSPSIHTRFEALARRAACEMPNPKYSDSLLSWLEAIRENSAQPGTTSTYSEQYGDGSEGPVHVVGSLHNLCEESAIYCNRLESEARQREFEEKQRNNPKNWSQFRQMYEAFKRVKEVRQEPPERIPEEFVRDAIARIHGIKPEDVTAQQIRFEVAGLLPIYPHIELIPTAPPNTPSSATAPGSEQQQESKPIPRPETPKPTATAAPETIAQQIQRLREECRWSVEQLAESSGLSPRQVARHISGESTPHPRNIHAYERAFSKRLKREVVLNQMS